MDLRQKLARLGPPGPASPGAAAPGDATACVAETLAPLSQAERLGRLKARLAEMTAKGVARETRTYRPARAAELHDLPGALELEAEGAVQVVRHAFPASHRHGRQEIAVGGVGDGPLVAALALDPALAALDPQRFLYLDTETTGLAGGTGTLAFLVGLGWFEGGAFVVEQLLLSRLSDEGPLLCRLAARLAAASAIVSFNGKSFDWPLLRTRFIMNRLAAPRPAHLDLLHTVRRVYRRHLLSLRLKSVEEEVLGLSRADDIDGASIPPLYWRFLKTGDGGLLQPVLEHNVQDILALPALLNRLATGFAGVNERIAPHEALGFARLALRNDDGARARRFAEVALAGRAEIAVSALRLVAVLEVRGHAYQAAADALHRALTYAAPDGTAAASIHLGLAKLYEHRLGDLDRAVSHAEHTLAAEGAAKRTRRLERLQRRRARQRERHDVA
ncbi:MAG: ribonuclease H-like domain-containing protein [Deltaproteobacteria bacterium]|nr:ribonuclease H-like domain-containing protein [Deltaproteobacteria bacterium]